MIWRAYSEYVYTTCARCSRKVPVSDCQWCDGILVCKMYLCYDRVVNGAFEFREGREVSRDRNELTPDPKLIHPVDPTTQIFNLPASSGTY